MIAIGQAAEQSGVAVETIRYYERAGIVPPPARAANGRRLYSEADVGRLRFIRRCRDLGFSMADARTLLDLADGNGGHCDEVQALSSDHLAAVRARIDRLRRLEAALEELRSNCRSGSPHCPMLEALKAAPDDAP